MIVSRGQTISVTCVLVKHYNFICVAKVMLILAVNNSEYNYHSTTDVASTYILPAILPHARACEAARASVPLKAMTVWIRGC